MVIRRTKFDLDQAEKRAHILEGLIIASDNIDEVIAIIKSSQTPDDGTGETDGAVQPVRYTVKGYCRNETASAYRS